MTVYYIDPGGGAGTKDGLSFANRARSPHELAAGPSYSNGNYFTPTGEHEIRIIANPEHTINNISTKKRPSVWSNGYNGKYFGSTSSLALKTTAGATTFRSDSHGLQTGDWIEIWQSSYYFNGTDASNNYGDGSTNNQAGNRIQLDGPWRVTVVDKDQFKLDGFASPIETDGTSSGSLGWGASNSGVQYNSGGGWITITSQVLEFPNSSSMEMINIASHGRNRGKWTGVSNTTTYDPYYGINSWGSSKLTMPPGEDNFSISSSQPVGKCAYFELPATLDLSAFQGISYEMSWYSGDRYTQNNDETGTGLGRFSLRLCTDTTGDTTAHTIPLDTSRIPQNNTRGVNTYDVGGNMNSAIKSVAVYKDDSSASYSVNMSLTNIIGYKTAKPVNHLSSLGFKTTNDPQFYAPQYIMNESSTNTYCIKLCNCPMYYYNVRSQMGYYGNMGCWWSQDITNQTLYVVESFLFGRHNSSTNQYNGDNPAQINDSNGLGQEFYRYNWNLGLFAAGPSVTDNNPHINGFKKISGGWNRTDMSSRTSANELSHFDNGWFSYYTGFYSSWNAEAQWFENLLMHRGSWQDESRFAVHKKIFVDCSYRYRNYGQNVNYMDIFVTNAGENSNGICIYNTQQYQGKGSYISDLNNGKWKLHWHGVSGQAQWEFSYPMAGSWDTNGREFEVFNVEMSRVNINRSTQQSAGDLKLGDVWMGSWGRETTGLYLSGSSQEGSTTYIDNLYSVYNSFHVQSTHRAEINNYVHKQAPTHTNSNYNMDGAAGAATLLGATNSWKVLSNSRPSYSLYVGSPNFTMGTGSVERRIGTEIPMKLNNFSNTDSDPHNITNRQAYIMSANDGGVAGAGKYYGYYWTMEPETTIVKTSGGKSWKITKTATQGDAKHSIGKIAVASGGTVTVKIWMYRGNTGTSVYGNLKIPADATLGINSDVVANNTTSSANTWTEVSVTCQPTSAGILDVVIETVTDSSTTSGSVYFDDMTVEQS